ncbi:four-helix bundle copper-binding protein [Deinococcus humi]|uniref:Ferredoxin n=1 Tax=Deinococcus humi TaxID=662880 RepID=A0A7W8K2C8_9DEIO|nr:four-helix bundle copper-binding protein [Deinococcus humi]MBB5366009.1 hypothetical protein [Deinococcus humi]GGO39665.1 hypothetical protein GCM10008949_48170 [Deinococcus humi]
MTQTIQAMLQTHPQPELAFDPQALAECIAACLECAQACTACADACLGEQEHLAHMVGCIRRNLDCADVYVVTAKVVSRLTHPDQTVLRAQLQACMAACEASGDECERHGRDMDMKHCAVCAESCRRCEAACARLVSVMAA